MTPLRVNSERLSASLQALPSDETSMETAPHRTGTVSPLSTWVFSMHGSLRNALPAAIW